MHDRSIELSSMVMQNTGGRVEACTELRSSAHQAILSFNRKCQAANVSTVRRCDSVMSPAQLLDDALTYAA